MRIKQKQQVKSFVTNHVKGFRLAAENAQQLYDAAITLEEKKQYGIANALLVLSAEEGVKALTILTQDYFPDSESLKKSFNDHPYKIETIRSMMGLYEMMQKFLDLFYLPVYENILDPKEDHQKVRDKSFENLKGWLEQAARSKKTDIAEQNSWWRSAQAIKEGGFYVSYSGERWSTPVVVKKTSYLKTKKFVTSFLAKVKLFYDLDLNDPMYSGLFTQIINQYKQRQR